MCSGTSLVLVVRQGEMSTTYDYYYYDTYGTSTSYGDYYYYYSSSTEVSVAGSECESQIPWIKMLVKFPGLNYIYLVWVYFLFYVGQDQTIFLIQIQNHSELSSAHKHPLSFGN